MLKSLGGKTIPIQSFPLLLSNKIKVISKVHLHACANKASYYTYLNFREPSIYYATEENPLQFVAFFNLQFTVSIVPVVHYLEVVYLLLPSLMSLLFSTYSRCFFQFSITLIQLFICFVFQRLRNIKEASKNDLVR